MNWDTYKLTLSKNNIIITKIYSYIFCIFIYLYLRTGDNNVVFT